MTKLKKFLTVGLSAILCVSFCTISSFASGCHMYIDDGGTAYDYLDAFGARHMKDKKLSGNGWSYDNETNTFILNGFNGSVFDFFDYPSDYDYRNKEYTIELAEGSVNYITYTSDKRDFFYYYDSRPAYFSYELGTSIFGIGQNVNIKGSGELIINSTDAPHVYALHLWKGEKINLAPNLSISGGTSAGAAEELTLAKTVNQSGFERVGLYLTTGSGAPATYVRICPTEALQSPPNAVSGTQTGE